MLTVADILHIIESWAPTELAWEKDNIGLLVGDFEDPVRGILICLDCTLAVVEEARQTGASLIIAHHPLMFRGTRTVLWKHGEGQILSALIRSGISMIAAHTNADSADRGLSVILAEKLGLRNLQVLEPSPDIMRSISPIGGTGDARIAPRWMASSQEVVTRVEKPDSPFGLGVLGELEGSHPVEEVLEVIKGATGATILRLSDPLAYREIQKLAICTGAGGSLAGQALRRGAQMYVTSDLGYHDFAGLAERMILVDAGHFETERLFVEACREALLDGLTETGTLPPVATASSLHNPVRFY